MNAFRQADWQPYCERQKLIYSFCNCQPHCHNNIFCVQTDTQLDNNEGERFK
jgi:hypothetical protein